MAKTEWKTYAAMGNGMAWCVGSFKTEAEARRAADAESGAAYVLRIDATKVYANRKRSPDAVRPFREALERSRPSK